MPRVSLQFSSGERKELGSVSLLLLVALLPVALVALSLALDSATLSLGLERAEVMLDRIASVALSERGSFSRPAEFTLLPDEGEQEKRHLDHRIGEMIKASPWAKQVSGYDIEVGSDSLRITATVQASSFLGGLAGELLGVTSLSENAMTITSTVRGRTGSVHLVLDRNALVDTATEAVPSVSREAERLHEWTGLDTDSLYREAFTRCATPAARLKRHMALALLRSFEWGADGAEQVYITPAPDPTDRVSGQFNVSGFFAGILASFSTRQGNGPWSFVEEFSSCIRIAQDPYTTGRREQSFAYAYLNAGNPVTSPKRSLSPRDLSEQLPTASHFLWALPELPVHESLGAEVWKSTRFAIQSFQATSFGKQSQSLIVVTNRMPSPDNSDEAQSFRDLLSVVSQSPALKLRIVLASASAEGLHQSNQWRLPQGKVQVFHAGTVAESQLTALRVLRSITQVVVLK